VNTVFARLGVYQLGAGALNEYAHRFAFNRYDVLTDMPLHLGRSDIEDDEWVLAEIASGWTDRNTLSPAHGAMLASAVGSDGRIPIPYTVERLTNEYGWPVYVGEPRHLEHAITPENRGGDACLDAGNGAKRFGPQALPRLQPGRCRGRRQDGHAHRRSGRKD
jgi:hypothetical protein